MLKRIFSSYNPQHEKKYCRARNTNNGQKRHIEEIEYLVKIIYLLDSIITWFADLLTQLKHMLPFKNHSRLSMKRSIPGLVQRKI